jgi:hypothetical protein
LYYCSDRGCGTAWVLLLSTQRKCSRYQNAEFDKCVGHTTRM